MPIKKKACIVDIKKQFRKKYLRQPSIDFDLAKSGQELCVLDIFVWDIYRDPPPLHNLFSNIKVDI